MCEKNVRKRMECVYEWIDVSDGRMCTDVVVPRLLVEEEKKKREMQMQGS